MAVYGSPEYQPRWYEKVYTAVAKRAPFVVGRFIQWIMYWIFQTVRFIGQVIKDAFS